MRIANKELKGITGDDLELYESNEYEKLSDEKWDLIYNQRQKEYKIQGLSKIDIREIDYNDKPNITYMLSIIGL